MRGITREISETGENDIEVSYPEFYGLNDGQDKAVNALIRDDIYGLVNGDKGTIYEAYKVK